jgi:2-oxoisovalerate dehydrogenase E1 component alpha subunit
MDSDVLTIIEKDGSATQHEPELSAEQCRRIYQVMVLTRALDERAMALQRQGRIGFYVPSYGQEASQVGSAFALEASDWVFPSYRDPGVLLLRGGDLKAIVNELYGNAADNTKGRQMPVHYAFKDQNFVSISSPIGTQIVQATGAAMAARIKGDKTVTMTYFGDGATSSNDFHTGLNFAGVFKAPVVFVCENNCWAISCPTSHQSASQGYAIKAKAYGMDGIAVDGNDVLAVYAVARRAVDKARRGQGPTLIETRTFRMGPHSSSDDPSRYRPKEQEEEWKRKDPIQRFRLYLEHKGLLDEAADQKMRDEAREKVMDAVREAEKVGLPAISTLFDDVYAELPPHLAAQRAWLLDLIQRGRGPTMHGEGEFPL